MYTKETKEYLAQVLGITLAEFDKNNSDEKEVSVTIPKHKIILEKDLATTTIFNASEKAEYEKNLKAAEYGRGVDEGKLNATEVLIKKINKDEGLGLTGSQLNEGELITALKGKFGSDSKALIEKFDSDKARLLSDATKEKEALEGKIQSMGSQIAQISLRNELNNAFEGELLISKDLVLDTFMGKVEKKKDEAGKEFYYLNGVKQENKELNPVPVKEVYNSFIIEQKLNKDAAGRGGGNEGGEGAGANTFKAFNEDMAKKGVHVGSATYQEELNKKLDDKDFRADVEKSE